MQIVGVPPKFRVNNVIVNILTLKWGTKYGPEYVNCLFAGVKRNLQRDFRFLCFTDNADDLSS